MLLWRMPLQQLVSGLLLWELSDVTLQYSETDPPPRDTTMDDGIFKAGEDRSEMWGASEVQEDENTKVEVPVDQRVAETVEEEVRNNEDQDGEDGEEVAEEEEEEDDEEEKEQEDDHNNTEAYLYEEQTVETEEHSMAEYSLPRPTSSRLLEKVSTPSEVEKECVAVA